MRQQNILTVLCLIAWIIYQVGYDVQTYGGVTVIESFVIWFAMLASFSKRGSKFDNIDKSSDSKSNEDEDESEFFKHQKFGAAGKGGKKPQSTEYKKLK